MKTFYTTTILLFTVLTSTAQIVPSSCDADSSVLESYRYDAALHTVTEVLGTPTAYQDSIDLPTELRQEFMDALIAVYNATTLPARDSVVEQYSIHNYFAEATFIFEITADSNAAWLSPLESNSWPSGHPVLDSIHDHYGFEVDSYFDYSGQLGFHSVTLKSDSLYNIQAIVNLMQGEPEIMAMGTATVVGDGSKITATMAQDHVFLDYEYGWGDCPAGCIWSYHWYFKVYDDCSVEFAGNSGTKPEPANVDEVGNTSIKVFPNPVDDRIRVNHAGQFKTYSIINLEGKVVQSGRMQGSSISTLSLNNGTYFIRFDEDRNAIRKIVVKHRSL